MATDTLESQTVERDDAPAPRGLIAEPPGTETGERTSPGSPPYPVTSFPGFAEAALQREEAGQRLTSTMAARDAALAPKLESAEAALGQRRQQIEATPPPTPPTLALPPSRGLRDFLAPADGEAPMTSLTKMLTGLGVLATGASGLVRGNARVGLAAMKGALQGWAEGDRERADREFATWQAETDTAIKQHALDMNTYKAIIENGNLSTQQMVDALKLTGQRLNLPVESAIWDVQNTDTATKFYAEQQRHGDELALRLLSIQEMRARAEQADATKRELAEQADATKREIAAQQDTTRRELASQADETKRLIAEQTATVARERLAATKAENDRRFGEKQREFNVKFGEAFGGNADPAMIEFAANWLLEKGTMPQLGAGMAAVRVAAMKRAAEITAQRGETPQDMIARQQMNKAVQGALTTNVRMGAQLGSFIKTADQVIKQAEGWSDKVDRTGVPVLNKWIQAGQRAVAGDPDITGFDIANATVAAEFARVMNSATGGGVSTVDARRHALELLSTAQTKEQYKTALGQIHREMHNRADSFKAETQELLDMTRKIPTPAAATPTAPDTSKDWTYNPKTGKVEPPK